MSEDLTMVLLFLGLHVPYKYYTASKVEENDSIRRQHNEVSCMLQASVPPPSMSWYSALHRQAHVHHLTIWNHLLRHEGDNWPGLRCHIPKRHHSKEIGRAKPYPFLIVVNTTL